MNWENVRFGKFLLKVAYVGTRYHGIAYQDESIPTIDLELFKALTKTCLIKDRVSCGYSRCGRTDGGVHALSNFVALQLRTKPDGSPLDYVLILNRVLPKDIRILSARLVPQEFDARFSCKSRTYRYFFTALNGIDVDRMKRAAGYLIGSHDFRNLCKMDVNQTTNHVRTIHSVEFVKDPNLPVYQVEIRGNAFLWNMIRSIMAVLLLVGEGLEDETVVRDLLDIEVCPRKPIYEIADPAGLVLFDCKYDEEIMEGTETNEEALFELRQALSSSFRDCAVLQAMACIEPDKLKTALRMKYTKLMDRGTAPSLDEKIQSANNKKRRLDDQGGEPD